MSRLRNYILGPVLGAIGLAALAVAPASAQVDIGTMAPGSVSNLTGEAIATVLRANDVEAAAVPLGGESELAGIVSDGGADLTIASILEVYNAYVGEGFWDGNPQPNLRVLAALAPLRVGLYVRADSNIFSILDLRGRTVVTDFTTLATIDTILQAVLANGGLEKDDIVPLPVADIVVGANEFIAGRSDAFFFALPGGLVAAAQAQVPGGIRLLPLRTGDAWEAAAEAIFPFGQVVTQPPVPNVLHGFSEPTAVMQYDNLLLVNADVSDEAVEEILGVLQTQQPALAAAFAGFGAFNPANMYKPDLPVPYHEAAVAYFEDMAADAE